ncbi:MAG: hypothetical protein HF978_17365 [Desulfobacteraceae bacterium]|nr:hypothetical protein [Desulfobacteraceae bacterium]MBC2757315.1 hypothetical protein [Desulfobacteraceae bacterium]
MLTKGDEYPIHQVPEPIAYAGSDRNFYDRYFFNGYSMAEEEFFAMALGVYPNFNIMDASFSVIKNGIQHNLRASKHLGMERMDTKVGPINIEVLEPLKSLRIIIDENEHGISADLTFTSRTVALEEPRYTHRIGPKVLMDYTRMTQNGSYSGWININGEKIVVSPEIWFGTRDRSWGIRPVGMPDPQPPAPGFVPQFFWVWAPVNFDDHIALYDINADAEGKIWHSHGIIVSLDDNVPQEMKKVESQIQFKSGTRHAESATIIFWTQKDEKIEIVVEPLYQFYMSGIGYLHPEWGHGMNKGELAVGYDTIDLLAANASDLLCLHIQAISRFTIGDKVGRGVLEQLIIGPHAPSGFKDLLDMAP